MPTIKLPESPEWQQSQRQTCRSPDHFAPSHYVYHPGRYRHTCSECGQSYEFTVETCSTS
jgi:hypothetical protein